MASWEKVFECSIGVQLPTFIVSAGVKGFLPAVMKQGIVG